MTNTLPTGLYLPSSQSYTFVEKYAHVFTPYRMKQGPSSETNLHLFQLLTCQSLHQPDTSMSFRPDSTIITMRTSDYQKVESEGAEAQCPLEYSTKDKALGVQGIKQEEIPDTGYTSKGSPWRFIGSHILILSVLTEFLWATSHTPN